MSVSQGVRTVLVTCLIAAVAFAVTPAGAAPTFSEQVIAGGSVPLGVAPSQTKPEMDGRHIVYEYVPGFELAPPDTDIRVYDLEYGVTTEVSDRTGDNDVDDINPDVSMDTVVYQSVLNLHVNVYLYNTSWYNWRAVTNETHAQTLPRISGRYILWHDAGTTALKYYCMDWPQYMNQQVPATVGVYYGSWDIDGDTVVYAREQTPGTFTFYKWTVWSDTTPEAFGTHIDADEIADVRLHNGRMTYTWGAALDNVGVMLIHDGDAGLLTSGGRDADLFHEMYAYEIIPNDNIGFTLNGVWSTTLGLPTNAETNPSAFGNRVAFERDSYNGDIIMTRSSEPLIDRTAGANRYETAAAVSKRYFLAGADSVVLCTGEDFPDALAAAPWARFLKAPVLLTQRTIVPEAVMTEIDRLGATNVWIIGGDGAVAPSVKTQLEAAGLTVNRELQGVDRYETSAKIANFLYDALIADGRPFSNTAFVARGDDFADALSVAPMAAATYSPIILVRTHLPLPPASDNVLKFLPIRYAWIVGGTAVVDEGVELAIEEWTTLHLGASSPATRIAGVDRYDTSARVLGNAIASNYLDLDTVGIATGLNFPDALGGGAALGTYGSPILLTNPSALPTTVEERITDHRWEIGRIDVFGGTSVVSDGVKNTVAGLLP
ncbi:MAG: cell wall-binding repeat-containing protein [Coriobacteriia bacterium]|nr:cell wall-binding repeat-containing protein [Coriobacteriia bacterium]